MKWLIVSAAENQNDVEYIKKLLESYNVLTSSFLISKNHDNESDCNKGIYQLMESYQKELFLDGECPVKDLSHLIILGGDSILANAIVLFLTGYMIGSQMPVLISDVSNKNTLPKMFSGCSVFSSVKEAAYFFKEHFLEYKAEEDKKCAHKKLFDEGIPFTPDCFSFHIAQNNTKECELFYQAGMSINCCDSAGTSMISMAVRSQKIEMIKWLFERKADINVISKDRGYTPVMDAVWKSDYEIVDFLIAHGAKLDTVSKEGQPILVLAVGTGNERICEVLVKNGANPLLKDAMGMSALDYAKLFKKTKLVDLFLQYAE